MKPAAIREPVNFFSHLIPAILAIPATALLVKMAEHPTAAVAAWVYGLCTILLFSISAAYHGFNGSEKSVRFWQKFDHCCIYLMIAGSYTPTSLLVFEGPMRWILFFTVWAIALVGCVLKISNKLKHKKLSLALYILMGCLIIPLVQQMLEVLPAQALWWMLLGGIFYIGGTFFYYQDRRLHRYIHSHEIWHLFVVAGAVSHYVYNVNFLF